MGRIWRGRYCSSGLCSCGALVVLFDMSPYEYCCKALSFHVSGTLVSCSYWLYIATLRVSQGEYCLGADCGAEDKSPSFGT